MPSFIALITGPSTKTISCWPSAFVLIVLKPNKLSVSKSTEQLTWCMGVSTTSLNVSANFVFPEPVGPLSKIFLFKSNNAFASLKTVESEFL